MAFPASSSSAVCASIEQPSATVLRGHVQVVEPGVPGLLLQRCDFCLVEVALHRNPRLDGIDLLFDEPGGASLQLADVVWQLGNSRNQRLSSQNRIAAIATACAQATRSSTGTYSSIAWAVSNPPVPKPTEGVSP